MAHKGEDSFHKWENGKYELVDSEHSAIVEIFDSGLELATGEPIKEVTIKTGSYCCPISKRKNSSPYGYFRYCLFVWLFDKIDRENLLDDNSCLLVDIDCSMPFGADIIVSGNSNAICKWKKT